MRDYFEELKQAIADNKNNNLQALLVEGFLSGNITQEKLSQLFLRSIELGNNPAARILLKADANPNIKDAQGNTPLMLAIVGDEKSSSNIEMIKVLLKLPRVIDNLHEKNHAGQTAFDLAQKQLASKRNPNLAALIPAMQSAKTVSSLLSSEDIVEGKRIFLNNLKNALNDKLKQPCKSQKGPQMFGRKDPGLCQLANSLKSVQRNDPKDKVEKDFENVRFILSKLNNAANTTIKVERKTDENWSFYQEQTNLLIQIGLPKTFKKQQQPS